MVGQEIITWCTKLYMFYLMFMKRTAKILSSEDCLHFFINKTISESFESEGQKYKICIYSFICRTCVASSTDALDMGENIGREREAIMNDHSGLQKHKWLYYNSIAYPLFIPYFSYFHLITRMQRDFLSHETIGSSIETCEILWKEKLYSKP